MKNKQIMTKKLWSLLVAVVYMFTMIPVFAAETETEIILSGNGTVESPYLIGTAEEMVKFGEMVEADAEANGTSVLCGKLTEDITLTNAWNAMALPKLPARRYAGTFDGDGHTISGMTAGKQDVQGFVGEAGEGLVIKNLTLEGVYNKEGQTYTGGFIGRTHGKVTLENCINKIDVTGKDRVSGFIGDGNYAHTFINCANYGTITGTTNVNGFLATGGSISVNYTNCANYGAITGNTAGVVAGLAGAGTFKNCIGYGSVTNSGPATAIYNAWGNETVSGENCYYRTGVVTGSPTPNPGTGKTSAQFASGELTYLLNGSSSENITWGQDLENDKYPVYGKTDYVVYNVDGNYSNKNEAVGTQSNPYLIGTEEQLKAFRDLVNAASASTLCAKLVSDIKLTSAWSRITNKYAGTFDGNGYTISGFSITSGDVRGFIGEGGTNLVIKNLTLEGTMTGVNHSAAFIGRANGKTTIDNCVNKVNVSGTHTLGGFVGLTSSAVEISNSVNYGDITATKADAANSYAGAFIGRENTQASSTVNCVNYGDITGLTGVASGILYAGSVTNSYNFGAVSNVGGTAAPITYWTKNGAASLVSNSYYDADKISGATVLTTFGTPKTSAQFASGEVAYLLNGGQSENVIFGQELGVDAYPVLGKTDYPVYKFDYIYTNSPEFFGTENNPYLIGTEEELIAFRNVVKADVEKLTASGTTPAVSTLCAKLTDDITLTSNWTPLDAYAGIFDGDGYTISGLATAASTYIFGFVKNAGDGLTFKNLTIEGALTLEGKTGAFVGLANGAVTFENCVNKADITGKELVGGFIGHPNGFAHSFKNCVNYGDITNYVDATAGGFMGHVGSTAQTFENCINYGAVSGKGGSVVAGIAGNGIFKNCIGAGTVTNVRADEGNAPATATYNRYGNTGVNCYYLKDSVTSNQIVTAGTEKTAEQFANGEVAYLLNKNAKEIICGQELTVDSYPVFGKDAMVWYNAGSYSNETGIFLAADTENVIFAAAEAATLYIAQYGSDDSLVEVKPVTVTAEVKSENIIANAEAGYAKVMVWNESLEPLCDGITIDFPEGEIVDFTLR